MPTTQEQVSLLTKSVGDLAEVVRDMARHVYKDGGMYAEEEDYEAVNPMGGDPAMGGGGAAPGMDPAMPDPAMADPAMADPAAMPPTEDPMMEEEMAMGAPPMRRSQTFKQARGGAKQLRRGYNDVAAETANEEDSPFDEQQDSIEGNEPSPAGEMAGEREDETFNANFMVKRLNNIEKTLVDNGMLVKAMVPGVPIGTRGRNDQAQTMGRDLEIQVKSRSFKELNELRTQMGDLPRTLFG